MSAFFAMGGYAIYVWPAFAVFFLVLLADYIAPGFRRRRTLREVQAKLRRQQGRQNTPRGQ